MQATVYDIVRADGDKLVLGVKGKDTRHNVLIMLEDRVSLRSFMDMGHRGYLTGTAYEMYRDLREES